MAQIIDGKAISRQVREEIAAEVVKFKEKYNCAPGLAVVIVGNDPASQVYVRNKKRGCEEVGFYSESYELDESTTQEELIALVERLNNNEKIHGILVQLPLPKHLNETEVLLKIKPEKDVDAFHPYNVGKIMIGNNFHSGKYCRILTSFHNYDKGSCIPYDDTMISKDVIIEDNVWIGEHVYILGGVTIGEGAVIQAGSVVCMDVPPLSIAGGHPAKAFKKRDEAHYYKLKNEKRFM